MMENKNQELKYKDAIIVISGQYGGRSGIFIKSCSKIFTDYCRIMLDLKGREKTNKHLMILKTDIKPA